MARSGPPAYAWDWFARQRLPWREVRTRLVASSHQVRSRYAAIDTRSDVLAALRADYPRDDEVRRIVDEVVAELVFLRRTDRPFRELGVRTAPRGLRWWWTALTGEDLEAVPVQPAAADGEPSRGPEQLRLADLDALDTAQALDDVHRGYGG